MRPAAAETVAELLRLRMPTPRREQIVHQHDQRRSLIERAPTRPVVVYQGTKSVTCS